MIQDNISQTELLNNSLSSNYNEWLEANKQIEQEILNVQATNHQLNDKLSINNPHFNESVSHQNFHDEFQPYLSEDSYQNEILLKEQVNSFKVLILRLCHGLSGSITAAASF